MPRAVRWIRRSLVAGAVLAGLVVAALLVVPRTDWAHRQLQDRLGDALAERMTVEVEIGAVRGNLLREAVLEDVVVRDSTGTPVIRAERLRIGYELPALLRRRVLLRRIELVEPRILLERSPDGDWNLAGLFRPDTAAADADGPAEPGLGSWVRVREATVRGGRIVVRTPWSPPEELEGPALDSVVAEAVSDRSRLRVEKADGAYRRVWVGRELDARLSDLVLADPDAPLSGELNSLSVVALPFRPPALEVRRLSGSVVRSDDTLRVRDLRLELPGSRIRGRATRAAESGELRGHFDVDRLSTADLTWLAPDLPRDGEARLTLRVRRGQDTLRLSASDLEARLEEARVEGSAELRIADSLRPGEADLRFRGIRTRTVERLAAGTRIPVRGTAEGRVRLRPAGDSLRVEASLAFREAVSGRRSRFALDGHAAPGGGRVGDMRVELRPLHVSLLESAAGELPVGGRIEGAATLDGSLDGELSARLDLTHRDTTGPTRLVGSAVVGPPGRERTVRARLRAPVLSLSTLGRFAPAAGLRGDATATLDATATRSRAALEASLRPEAGGTLTAAGVLEPGGPELGYDLRLRFDGFDAARASGRAPATDLSGTLTAEGRGTDPAGMRAALRAELSGATVGSTGPFAADLRVRAEEGRLHVEEGELELGSAVARIRGSLGLAAGREGELRVELEADSLRALGDRLPLPAEDSLSGAIRFEGALSGSREALDARGRLEVRDFRGFGVRAGAGRLDFTAAELTGSAPAVGLDFAFDTLGAAGFAFERVEGRAEHLGAGEEGEGSVSATLVQDPRRDYRFRAGYTIEVDDRELRLERMTLRFDTVRWASSRPGRIRWGPGGVEVDSLELRTGGEGRIFVDGRFAGGEDDRRPGRAAADSVLVEVEALPLSHVLGVIQDTVAVSGMLAGRVSVRGPVERARMSGRASLTRAAYGETPLPSTHLRAEYVPGELDVGLRLLRPPSYARGEEADTLARAEATAAVDLFRSGTEASGALEASIRADSLPLESLPLFTDAVDQVRGRMRGRVDVGGTVDEPEVEGRIDVDVGQVRVVWPGVVVRDLVGTLDVDARSVRIDSLRALSGGGAIRLAGGAEWAGSAGPRLDLSLTAEDARVLDNRIGENVRVDAELAARGRYDSLAVNGRVRVREGILTVPEIRREVVDLQEPLPQRALASMPVDPELAPEPSPLLEGLRMEVDLEVSRNTWVRADQGTSEIYTPEGGDPFLIRYERAAGGIVLDGILHADRGEYRFAGRRFDITTGTATFLASHQVDPLLGLTAVHEVPRPGREALSIQIHVGGRLYDPRITLSSNAEPPLSQTDLISYLVFGRSSSALLQPGSSVLGGDDGDLGALATQQLASLAIGALVEEAFSSVESSTRGSGLDVVRIEPAELPEELAFEGYLENLLRGTQVEAGKYLSRRLFVAATGRPTTETWPGLTVEYRAPGGFRLTGSWEHRYLPSLPTFGTDAEATRTRSLGVFLFWEPRTAGQPGAGPVDGLAPDGEATDEDPVGGGPAERNPPGGDPPP